MTVAVYPRLAELLREGNLTVADLKRQVHERYGLELDSGTLDRLARPEPVQRTDLTIAGAAAMVLGVGLGDLFFVEAIPVAVGPPPEDDYLDKDQTQRMGPCSICRTNGPSASTSSGSSTRWSTNTGGGSRSTTCASMPRRKVSP